MIPGVAMSVASGVLALASAGALVWGSRDGRSRRAGYLLVALFALVPVGLATVSMNLPPIYLDADSGSYLTDARAILGDGVHSLGHPPLFPVLLALLRLAFGDLLAIKAAMVLVLLAAQGSAIHLLAKRGLPLVAVAFGALVFGLFVGFPEAVGWYGGSSLLGLAICVSGIRFLEDALVDPDVRRWGLVAAAAVLLLLTHPFSVALFAQVTLVLLALLTIRRLRVPPGGESLRGWLPKRLVGLGCVVGIMVVAQVALSRAWVTADNPYRIDLTLSQFSSLGNFLEPLTLGWGLLVLNVLPAPSDTRSAGRTLLRVSFIPLMVVASVAVAISSVWFAYRALRSTESTSQRLWAVAAAVTLVVIANVLLLKAQVSFVVRNLYFLAIPVGALATLLWVQMSDSALLHARRRTMPVLAALFGLGILLTAGYGSYMSRGATTASQYSTTTPSELAAMRWMQGKPGLVLAADRDGGLTDATNFARMLEGIAGVSAFGSGEAWQFQLPGQLGQSMAASRLDAGDWSVESDGVQVAWNDSGPLHFSLAVRIQQTWVPIAVLVPRAADGGEISAHVTGSGGDQPGARMTWQTAAGSARIDLAGGAINYRSDSPTRLDIVFGALDRCPAELQRRDKSVPRPKKENLYCGLAGTPGMFTTTANHGWIRGDIEGAHLGLALTRADAGGIRLGTDRESVQMPAVHSGEADYVLKVSGNDAVPGDSTVMQAREIMAREGVKYVFTWNRRAAASHWSARPCLLPVYGNSEVTIYRTMDACPD